MLGCAILENRESRLEMEFGSIDRKITIFVSFFFADDSSKNSKIYFFNLEIRLKFDRSDHQFPFLISGF